MSKKFQNIPTNIISGFLGAGKTTAIQYLLKHKPATEKWAIIVNEFGKIGIDGEFLKNENVEIKQIPGGCLCCVGSQSLSVGLNQLIKAVEPQRIIIEPTGLGHPAKLISTLTGGFYKSVLDLKAVINLVDARNLNNERYVTNESFIDQSNLADVLVASKMDLYAESDKEVFYHYAESFNPAKLKLAMVEQGRLALSWLDLSRNVNRDVRFPNSHSHHSSSDIESDVDNPSENTPNNWLMIEGHANGFSSVGWKINEIFVFDKAKLILFVDELFCDINIERVKGVVITDQGGVQVNCTRTEHKYTTHQVPTGSILELISSECLNVSALDRRLKSALKIGTLSITSLY